MKPVKVKLKNLAKFKETKGKTYRMKEDENGKLVPTDFTFPLNAPMFHFDSADVTVQP